MSQILSLMTVNIPHVLCPVQCTLPWLNAPLLMQIAVRKLVKHQDA